MQHVADNKTVPLTKATISRGKSDVSTKKIQVLQLVKIRQIIADARRYKIFLDRKGVNDK